MKRFSSGSWPALAVGACLAIGSLAYAGDPLDRGSVELTHRVVREWNLELPAEQFTPVSATLPFEGTLGRTFKTGLEGTALAVDSDGDGEFDVRADGKSALVRLRGKAADGSKRTYALRLTNQSGWRFASSGVQRGKIGDTKIRLIDQNNNGSFADFGEDAVIVGRGRYASFLAPVLRVKGQLLQISVTPDGSTLRYEPYTGATGQLDLGDNGSTVKLLQAMIRSADGRLCFDLAGASGAQTLPAGRYHLLAGQLGLGKNRVRFERGRSQAFVVTAGETTKLSWGGPVSAEFAYHRVNNELNLSPDQVWYYGEAGEQYTGWFPLGKSPEFTIRNRKTGREIAQAYFPGTC